MKSSLNKTQKKLLVELQSLVDQFGYWSDEVNQFNSSLSYNDSYAINLYVKKTFTKNTVQQ